MPPRASFTTRTAWLGHEFGESYARRLFGDEVVDALPRYTRGKNVGKFKVELEWTKVESGGWVSAGVAGYGHVENRVGRVIDARIVSRDWETKSVTKVHANKEL